jgi:hypothetical protein
MMQLSREQLYEITSEYKKGNMNNYDKIYYRKIEGLRRTGIIYAYTQEELIEYSKCATDVIYFIEKYCTIQKRNIRLYNFQIDIINKYKDFKFNAVKNSRQSGLSLIMSLLALHELLFSVDNTIVVIANKQACGIEIMDKIRTFYIELPFFLKAGVVSSDKTKLRLENGNRIVLISSTTGAIGFQIHKLFIQDFAYFNNKFSVDLLHSIFPCISAIRNSKLFIQSSGRSEYFDQIITNGERMEGDPLKNNFMVTKVHWWQIPNRDEDWAKQQIKTIGKELFDQEYDLL